jgi:hypothetical protein
VTNASGSFRTLLIYAMILPVALVVGYMMATPMDQSTIVVVGLLLLLLCTPLLLKWHYPLLFLVWNTTMVAFFLPGRPQFWLVFALGGLMIAIIQRTLVRDMRFIHVPSLAAPLFYFGFVVVLTAKMTGGFGMQFMGGETAGGKRYLLILISIVGFFAMIARRIPKEKALFYVGLFFLGSLLCAIGDLFPLMPPNLYYLFLVFPVASFGSSGGVGPEVVRWQGLALACVGAAMYLLARNGVREPLVHKSYRKIFLFFFVVVIGCLGGYRMYFILSAATFMAVLYYDGLLRSKYTAAMLGCFVLLCAIAIPLANKLPLSIQRSISFLPVDVDPIARQSAETTSEWRLKLWQVAVTEVPKYFWFGRGLAMNAQEMEEVSNMVQNGTMDGAEGMMLSGDYHNGPLTSLIPFGIWGFIGWVWILIAGWRALVLNRRYGDPDLHKINTLLLAYFVVRTILFFTIFGNLYTDFAIFIGIIGLSIAINHGIKRPVVATVPTKAVPFRARRPLRPMPAFGRERQLGPRAV